MLEKDTVYYSKNTNGDSGIDMSANINDKPQLKHLNRPHTWHPPTDLYEVEDAYIVRVEIAGMNTEDFLVNLNNQRLEVTGIRPDVSMSKAYHQMEIPYGHFKTIIHLRTDVDNDGVVAEYQDGFLIITLPKIISKSIKIMEE